MPQLPRDRLTTLVIGLLCLPGDEICRTLTRATVHSVKVSKFRYICPLFSKSATLLKADSIIPGLPIVCILRKKLQVFF